MNRSTWACTRTPTTCKWTNRQTSYVTRGKTDISARFNPKLTLPLPRGINSHEALPEILHHTVWRTWLFVAYSDERWLCYQFSLPHRYKESKPTGNGRSYIRSDCVVIFIYLARRVQLGIALSEWTECYSVYSAPDRRMDGIVFWRENCASAPVSFDHVSYSVFGIACDLFYFIWVWPGLVGGVGEGGNWVWPCRGVWPDLTLLFCFQVRASVHGNDPRLPSRCWYWNARDWVTTVDSFLS